MVTRNRGDGPEEAFQSPVRDHKSPVRPARPVHIIGAHETTVLARELLHDRTKELEVVHVVLGSVPAALACLLCRRCCCRH